MNILHIYSDWKWTGPAEPIFNLCEGLKNFGHNISFAGWLAPDNSPTTLSGRLKDKGINFIPLRQPAKLTGLFALMENINRIERFISTQPVQVIHVHTSLDHFIAARAIRHLTAKPKITRTNHQGIPLYPSLITNYLIKRHTDGYITLSQGLLQIERKLLNLPAERSWFVESAVDTERFNSENIKENLRPQLGLQPDDFVVGVVARVQRHRRFEVILSALNQLVKEFPHLKLLVIGRGTYQDEVLTTPAREMKLTDRIIHISQRLTDGDYVSHLSVIDIGLYLVPGSDGSCRAVREMMSLAKPVIVSQRGILPELVQDKVTGLVIDDTVENLVGSVRQFMTDRPLVLQYGFRSHQYALQHFSLNPYVKEVEGIYRRLITA